MHNLGIGAQDSRLDVDLGQATCLKMLQVGAQLGNLAGTAWHGSRAVDPGSRARASIASPCPPMLAKGVSLGDERLRQGKCLGTRGGQLLLPFGQLAALADALFALRCGGGPLLLDGLHPALQVGVEPLDALEGRLGTAPPLFKAGHSAVTWAASC